MSKDGKKFLIAGIIIFVIAIIIAVVVGINVSKKVKAEREALKMLSERFNVLEKIAMDVNLKIDEKNEEAQKYLDTKPDVGEDKTLLKKLSNSIEKLKETKIEIPPKTEIKEDLEKLVEKLEQTFVDLDEGLLDLENEEINLSKKDETVGDMIDEVTGNKKLEIEIDTNSKLGTLMADIDKTVRDIQIAVKAETERKAEAEMNVKE